jgi:hypothetical protein
MNFNPFKRKLAISTQEGQGLSKPALRGPSPEVEPASEMPKDPSPVMAEQPSTPVKLSVKFSRKATSDESPTSSELSSSINANTQNLEVVSKEGGEVVAKESTTQADTPKKSWKDKLSKTKAEKKESNKPAAKESVPSKKTKAVKKEFQFNLLSKLKIPTLGKTSDLHILTEVDSIGAIAWKIGPSSLNEVEINNATALLSFSHHDKRYSVDPGIKSGDAQNLVLSENGESYYINKASSTEALYATSVSRVQQYQKPICPAVYVLEEVLKDKLLEAKKFIIGVNLVDQSTQQSLVAYYFMGLNREISEPEVVINPASLDFLLTTFAIKNKAQLSECEVYLLNNQEIAAAVAKYWHGYPLEPEIYGFSIRKLMVAATMVGMGCAAVSTGYAGVMFYQKSSYQAQEDKWKQETATYKAKTNELIMSGVLTFSKTQEIPLAESFKDAHNLWIPGSIMTMTVSPERRVYELQAPLASDVVVLEKAKIKSLVNIAPPEGCVLENVLLTGALNDIKVKVQCEIPAGPLSGYRIS